MWLCPRPGRVRRRELGEHRQRQARPPHRSGQRADHSCHRRLPQGSRLEAGEARRGLLVLRRKPRRQDLRRVATAMSLDDRTRTWQLVMTGDDLRHVTLETQADMARLLDLRSEAHTSELQSLMRISYA